MAGLVVVSRERSRPLEFVAAIDYSNPLTKNLAFAFRGGLSFDIGSRDRWSATGSPLVVAHPEGGLAWRFNGTSNAYTRSVAEITPLSFTFAVVCTPRGLTTQDYIVACGSSTDNDPVIGLRTGATTAANPEISVRDDAGGGSLAHAPVVGVFTVDRPVTIVGTYDGATACLYTPIGFNTAAFAAGAITLDRTAIGGLLRATLTLNAQFDVALALGINRPWNQGQAYDFISNPWQMFEPERTLVYFPDAGGVTGDGDLIAAAAAIDGEGISLSTGSGALAAAAATLAGVGTVFWQGSGALNAQAATVDGAGTSGSTGTGALVAGSADITGTADNTISGSGALNAQAADVDGAGTSSSTGTGALAAQAADVNGAGTSSSTGTGSLVCGSADITGLGGNIAVATGALLAQAADITGAGVSSSTGSGVLTGQAADINGAGVSSSVGSGVLVCQAATVVGSSSMVTTGTGVLTAQSADVTGAGISRSVGAGVIAASFADITGAGVSRSTGTGTLVAQSAIISGGLFAAELRAITFTSRQRKINFTLR